MKKRLFTCTSRSAFDPTVVAQMICEQTPAVKSSATPATSSNTDEQARLCMCHQRQQYCVFDCPRRVRCLRALLSLLPPADAAHLLTPIREACENVFTLACCPCCSPSYLRWTSNPSWEASTTQASTLSQSRCAMRWALVPIPVLWKLEEEAEGLRVFERLIDEFH